MKSLLAVLAIAALSCLGAAAGASASALDVSANPVQSWDLPYDGPVACERPGQGNGHENGAGNGTSNGTGNGHSKGNGKGHACDADDGS